MEPQVEEQRTTSDENETALESLPVEDWIESAERWISENRTLALVGSFAFGVFVGVMMKD